MRIVRLAGALLLLALLGACGSGDAQPGAGGSVHVAAASPAAGSTELPSQDALRTYFAGIATATMSSYEEAAAVALPGSPAAAYVTYLRAAAQAVIDGGDKVEKSGATAEVRDGHYEFCSGKSCYDYSDITGADGKVVDFSVNGKPLGHRVSVGSDAATPVPGLSAQASFVAAFESSAGDNLFVVVRLEAGTQGLARVSGTYRSSAGDESASSRMSGPARLDPGVAANYAFAFAGARIGGTVVLSVHDAGGTVHTVPLAVS